MPDGAGDGGLERLADGVGEADETEVAGEGRDHLLTLVASTLAHHGAEGLSEFLQVVVGHRGRAGMDEVGTIGVDNAAADGGSKVAPEGLVDLGAEPLVAEDEGDFLEKLVAIEPALATGGLAERCQDVVGLNLADGAGRAGGSGVVVG